MGKRPSKDLDVEIEFTATRLQHIVREHGCYPLDDRQAEVLAKHVNELQGRIDDLSDKCDALEVTPPATSQG